MVAHLIKENTEECLKYEQHNSESGAAIDCETFEKRQRKFDSYYEKAKCNS
jgi:hypothetical protein